MRQALHDDYSINKPSAYLARLGGREVWITKIFTDNDTASPFLRDPSAWSVEVQDLLTGELSVVRGNKLSSLDRQPGLWTDIALRYQVSQGCLSQEAFDQINQMVGRDYYRYSED